MKSACFVFAIMLFLSACQTGSYETVTLAECDNLNDDQAIETCRTDAYERVRDVRQDIRKTRRVRRN